VEKTYAFLSYLFRAEHRYVGLLDLMERQGLAVVNKSIDPWNPPQIPDHELLDSLHMRIRTSTHVLVPVTDGLEKSRWCKIELQIAAHYDKPVIAVFPPGKFGAPIPRALDEGLYRAVGWRGGALERAIRGDYPPDSRVFDIMEDVQRARAVAILGAAVAGASLLLWGASDVKLNRLRAELRAAGIAVPEPQTAPVAPLVVGGVLLGALAGSLLGSKRSHIVAGALLGGAASYGAGKTINARAEIRRLGPLLQVRRLPMPHTLKAA
jgi:hypothetical protein